MQASQPNSPRSPAVTQTSQETQGQFFVSAPASPEPSRRSPTPVVAATDQPPPPVDNPYPVLSVATTSATEVAVALGVTRHRRKSRPSVSPERTDITAPTIANISHRLPRLRRQSTTLDDGSLASIFVLLFIPK